MGVNILGDTTIYYMSTVQAQQPCSQTQEDQGSDSVLWSRKYEVQQTSLERLGDGGERQKLQIPVSGSL